MRALQNSVQRATELPRARVTLFLEAVAFLLAARLALALVPFRRIGRHLGHMRPPSLDAGSGDAAALRTAEQVRWAVRAAGDRLPGGAVCLPRALAAWQMLHRRGMTARLHFGAQLRGPSANTPGETHAWLTSAGVEVTGYPVAHDCVEVGYFSRAGRKAL